MKRPLVKPKSSKDIHLKKLIKFYDETLGFCPNSIKTMHIRPEIAYAFIGLNKAVMHNKGRVTSDLKRMIGYISSNASGCRYCEAHSIRAAERYGAKRKQIENIWNYKTSDVFSEKEKITLEFAHKSSLIPNAVNDKLAEKLRKYWDDGEIVEILGVVALFGFLNRWNDSMGTPIENDALKSGKEYIKNWNPEKHIYNI
tara:strand:- start:87 stop:683 length:597 start_codon:yes stop_codon:yes gene_type:complete